MHFKTLIFLIIFCGNALASNAPSASSVFISGGAVNSVTPSINLPVTTTALSTRVGLAVGSSSTGSGVQYFSFSSMTQTVTGCYTPTNTLYCTGLTLAASVANTGFNLGYGTSCVYNSVAPTAPQYYSSASGNYMFNTLNATINVPVTVPLFIRFPSGKVPFVVATWTNAQSFSIALDCVEL